MATCAVLVACLGAADAAQACNEPYVAVNVAAAGPRDKVAWTVANVEPRATWVVTLEGRRVAGGTAGATAPSGTYVIPNFGSSSRPIHFALSVVHDEASQTHEGSYRGTGNPATITYKAPAVAPERPEPPPATTPPPEPLRANEDISRPTKALDPVDQRKKQGPQGNRPNPGPPTDRPAGFDPAPGSPGPAPSEPSAEERLPAETVVPAQSEPFAADRPGVTATPPRIGTQEPVVLPGPQPPRRLPLVRAGGRAEVAATDREGLPVIALVGAGLLLICAGAATVWWTLRGRGSSSVPAVSSPTPQPAPPGVAGERSGEDLRVEAELQELIAEERAREMSRETAAIRTGPG